MNLEIMAENHYYEVGGYCPICEREATFVAHGKWYRGTLSCRTCPNGSVPRERGLAYVLKRERPDWRKLVIHGR